MILESVRQALRTLRAQKLRTALTLFGIVWGTASVIFLMGWGEGLRLMLEDAFMRSGKNMAIVWAGTIGEDYTPAADRRWIWYELDDVASVRRRAHLPDFVSGEAFGFGAAVYRQKTVSADVRGVEPAIHSIRGVPVARGRSLTQADVDLRKRVAILGPVLAERLFGPEARPGRHFRLDGKSFEMIGILEKVGTQLAVDRTLLDEQMWVPITTHSALWPRHWTEGVVADRLLFRVPERQLYDAAKAEVRGILAERMRISAQDDEAIGIASPIEVLRRMPFDQTQGLMFLLGAGTLLIGGIGVLTLMLDSVRERRAEIGTRMAVGARRRDIVVQFFLETLTVTGLGGILGLLLGIGGCLVLSGLEVPDLVPVPVLRLEVVQVALGFLVLVGVSAGVLPAWRASRIDPASTLRMD